MFCEANWFLIPFWTPKSISFDWIMIFLFLLVFVFFFVLKTMCNQIKTRTRHRKMRFSIWICVCAWYGWYGIHQMYLFMCRDDWRYSSSVFYFYFCCCRCCYSFRSFSFVISCLFYSFPNICTVFWAT